jgi:hypothetical protein
VTGSAVGCGVSRAERNPNATDALTVRREGRRFSDSMALEQLLTPWVMAQLPDDEAAVAGPEQTVVAGFTNGLRLAPG